MPSRVVDMSSFCGENISAVVNATGVRRKREAVRGVPYSEFAFHSAHALLDALGWNPSSVEVLVSVTQTPDHQVPPGVYIVQEKVGIPTDSVSLEIRSGCTGFIHGLLVLLSLMECYSARRGLLVCGDLSTIGAPSSDMTTYSLFGDAVASTCVEKDNRSRFVFHVASTGQNYDAIMVRDGGSRFPITENSLLHVDAGAGNKRRGIDIHLDGLKILNFTLTTVAEAIKQFMESEHESSHTIDYFFFHQASKIVNEALIRRLSLPSEKCPSSLAELGNTSSASIPLTINTALSGKHFNERLHVLACGFGVGLSWGIVTFDIYPDIVLLPIIEI